ncbi:protein-serine,threonine phosphatase, partial [Sarracenia purpurea var. burkii]
MAVCGSRAILGDCSLINLTSKLGFLAVSTNNAAIFYNNRILDSCTKASMCLRNGGQPNNLLLYGCFICNVMKRRGFSIPYLGFGSGLKGFHCLALAYSSAGSASDVSFDNYGHQEQLANASVSSEHPLFLVERTTGPEKIRQSLGCSPGFTNLKLSKSRPRKINRDDREGWPANRVISRNNPTSRTTNRTDKPKGHSVTPPKTL